MKPEEVGQAILRALADPQLFGAHFTPPESWIPWLTAIRSLFGLPLSAEEMDLFTRCTGRTQPFTAALTEAWFAIGRRAGKSRVLALLAVCLATFRDYSAYLAPGERPLVMVLAKDRDQAGVIFGYARALIAETPMLAKMLIRETSDTLELSNGVFIGVHTSSYKSVRGRTVVACLNDEIAFWESDDSRNPAAKILAALRPSISTIPGAMLLCASSTYTQDGPLYEVFQKHHGRDTSSVMVWKADTQTMNPSFRQDVIDAAYVEDPQSAAAEYGSEWLSDARAHFPDADIDAAIVPDRQGLVRDQSAEFIAFCDPSGGVSDSMTLAIAHSTPDRRLILDRLEVAKPPFKPEDVCQRFADVLSGYGLTQVTGDRFGSGWVPDAFRRFGIHYVASELNASEIYIAAQPLFTQRRVELLDSPSLAGELRRLERRPRAGGRDQVTHPRGSHDDQANSVCGALVEASRRPWLGHSTASEYLEARHVKGSDYNPFTRHAEKMARLDDKRR